MEQTIKIYNSLSRKKDEFVPLNPPQVKMYVCGPTVYDEPHIGHARSAYIFDVIRRYLIYKGYKVTFVRNVTDVDDKIIDKAIKEYKGEDLNSSVKKVAEKYLSAYHEAMSALNISSNKPDVIEPKATEYIDKMIEFIKNLINRGVAYESGGDVYFDIKKAENYGKLSNQSIDKMEIGARGLPGENKKDPLDFALWKTAKEREPSWDSPWGRGRPGWHIECSVMSSDILGDKFDIHGGGIDLIFPHHENEIAQSEGAGKEFAKYWIHHGLLTINGQKMSKSLGNFITVSDILKRHSADALKVFFLSTHYSHPIDFTEERIQEADRARGRFINLNDRLSSIEFNKKSCNPEVDPEIDSLKKGFEDSMDDDFNTPQAIAALFKMVSVTDGYFTRYKKNIEKIIYAKSVLLTLTNVLGLSLARHEFKMELADSIKVTDSVKIEIVEPKIKDTEIEEKIKLRDEVRKKMDFKKADEIREELEGKGIILEDTKDGTIWRRKL